MSAPKPLPLSERLLRGFGAFLGRLLYRVTPHFADRLPAGGFLLLPNHLTWVDAIVLQLACPRPIRFMGFKGLRRNAFFNWCFEMSGCIDVSATNPIEGMRAGIRALKRGAEIAAAP